MVFPGVKRDMDPGPQNHHLIAYKHNGVVDSITINSSYIQERGIIDLVEIINHVRNRIDANEHDQVELLSIEYRGKI